MSPPSPWRGVRGQLRPWEHAPARLNQAATVTLFCGAGVAGAHAEVMELAGKLQSPIGHTLRGKEWIQYDSPDDVGMNGLLGYGACYEASHEADLLVQLGHDRPSHIVVPAIHKNRAEIREIFLREMGDAPPDLSDDPHALAEAARRHLRRKFLEADVAVSGANFAVAETGSLLIAESEGNGRMCVTLPQTLVSVVGIEKLVPSFRDLEGHAHGATDPGPIGAILTPQLVGVEHASKLPFASSLCGYCYEVCPVKIDIPTVLVKLRHDSVQAKRHRAEDALFAAAGSAMKGRRRWSAALRLAPLMRLVRRGGPPPVAQWTSVRDLPEPPARSFRDWWVKEHAREPVRGHNGDER